MSKPALGAVVLGAAILGASGCISRGVAVERLTVLPSDSRTVSKPVKTQLQDGSIGVFPQGLVIDRGQLRGSGWRYTPTLRDSTVLTSVPLDSVASLEVFSTHINEGRTFIYSLLGSAGAAFLALATALGICLASPSCRLM